MFSGYFLKAFLLPALLAGVCVCSAFALDGKAVSLTTSDGWNVAGVYKAAEPDKKTVLLLHDLGKNKEEFTSFAKALAKAGYGYLAIDLRGHGQSKNLGEAYAFAKEGVDNDYNKMARDADAALNYLQKQGVKPDDTVVLGAGLGANVAAKSMSFWPDTFALALISPSANNKDVLTIPAMRLYKGNVLIGVAADDKKLFLEASVIRNVAFLSSGEGKVTFLTAYNLASHAMLDKFMTPAVLQWLSSPQRPEVLPDVLAEEDFSAQTGATLPVPPSQSEESLQPSVLF